MPKRKIALLILVEAGLWVACILAMAWLYDRWLIAGPNGPIHWIGMDSVLFWVAARAMLAGQSPYSAATVHLIQAAVMGGPPQPGGDPMLFVYPAWIFLLITPWVLLPLKSAIAVWTGSLLFGMLHLLGSLAIRWGGRRAGLTSLWGLLLALGSLPFVAIAVTKGQISLVCLGSLFLAIRLIAGLPGQAAGAVPPADPTPARPWKTTLRASLAGAFLVLAVLKPTLTALAVAGILLWAVIERKGWIIAGFAACLALLYLASWLAIGNWFPDYLHLLGSTGGAPILWSLAMLAWPWNALYAALFGGIGISAFILFLRKRDRAQWFSAAILVGLALFPMRWVYDLLLGILVPAEARQMSRPAAICTAIALLAPWGLALFPEPVRWPALVIGLPLAWAAAWLALFAPFGRRLRPFFAL